MLNMAQREIMGDVLGEHPAIKQPHSGDVNFHTDYVIILEMEEGECMEREKTFQCRVCGASFTSRDDVEEDIHGTGFWCSECDSFTPYVGTTRTIDLSVCLETKASSGRGHPMDGKTKSDLQGDCLPYGIPGGH